ncbi:MAG: hypothetical protein H6Q77_1363 [Gemmatimonadetes bacterium]|nr:hypothetical protein [Gemmatimonadota bacterium]
MRVCAGWLASLVLAGGCGEKGTGRPADTAPTAPKAEAPAAALALQVSDSVAVWFTSARADTAADGTACLERVMEIRAGARAIPIPLLYTGEAPTITSDSTLQVHVWRHCVPADLYRVHLRTGQPTRAGS